MEQRYGSLDFEKKEIVYDLKTITADFLIKQIDYSFKAWHEKPWAKKLSFEQFCEYVLPYRGSNEPMENWREFFWEKYKGLEKKMTDPSDAIQAAKLINDEVSPGLPLTRAIIIIPLTRGFPRCSKIIWDAVRI